MKPLFSLILGAAVAMLLVSLIPLRRDAPDRPVAAGVTSKQPALPVPAPPVRRPTPRTAAPEAQAHAAKAVESARNRAPSSRRYPSEETRLSSVYDYWAAQAQDPLVTAGESSRIRELLEDYAVEPTSLEISCTSKICRSQMAFTDVESAARLHALSRREDRRIYAGADPGDNEMRVSLYWTLTDEATAEAPEPVPQPGDLPAAAEPGDAYEREAAQPLGG